MLNISVHLAPEIQNSNSITTKPYFRKIALEIVTRYVKFPSHFGALITAAILSTLSTFLQCHWPWEANMPTRLDKEAAIMDPDFCISRVRKLKAHVIEFDMSRKKIS